MCGAALLSLCLGVGSLGGVGQASAQDSLDALDLDLSGYAVGVFGGVDDGFSFNDDDLRFGADAQLAFSGSYLFENGIEVGVEASGNLEDDPERSLAAGFVPLGAPLNENCAIGPDAAAVGIVCAFVREEDDDIVRDSFMFVEGFFGEVSFGRQQGVAHEMSFLPPNVFFATAVNDWETDLTGFNTINTRNTVNNGYDDYAFRVNYRTPRVLGAQLGISYAPNTESCGATLCPTSMSRLFPDYDDVVEVGVNYFYTFSNGLSIGVSGTYLAADTEGSPKFLTTLEDYQSWNLGANVRASGFTFGASYKQNNLGRDGVDYTAYDVGATYETGPVGLYGGLWWRYERTYRSGHGSFSRRRGFHLQRHRPVWGRCFHRRRLPVCGRGWCLDIDAGWFGRDKLWSLGVAGRRRRDRRFLGNHGFVLKPLLYFKIP